MPTQYVQKRVDLSLEEYKRNKYCKGSVSSIKPIKITDNLDLTQDSRLNLIKQHHRNTYLDVSAAAVTAAWFSSAAGILEIKIASFILIKNFCATSLITYLAKKGLHLRKVDKTLRNQVLGTKKNITEIFENYLLNYMKLTYFPRQFFFQNLQFCFLGKSRLLYFQAEQLKFIVNLTWYGMSSQEKSTTSSNVLCFFIG